MIRDKKKLKLIRYWGISIADEILYNLKSDNPSIKESALDMFRLAQEECE